MMLPLSKKTIIIRERNYEAVAAFGRVGCWLFDIILGCRAKRGRRSRSKPINS